MTYEDLRKKIDYAFKVALGAATKVKAVNVEHAMKSIR